jgi:hypothetical protein
MTTSEHAALVLALAFVLSAIVVITHWLLLYFTVTPLCWLSRQKAFAAKEERTQARNLTPPPLPAFRDGKLHW